VKIPYEQPPSIGKTFIDLAPEVTVAILKTLESGWKIAVKKTEVNTAAKEIAITECLRDGMRVALQSGDLPWRKSMIVLPGTESKSNVAATVPDGRTDIPLMLIEVFLKWGEHDPHAIIECKRVAEGNATLVREYVTEGVDRFCSAKYGKNHSRGFMAGYVLAGSPDGVVLQLNAFFDKNHREPEHLKNGIPGFWVSRHPRKNSHDIELHHGMLAVN
jgi:hypothetical protein